MALVLVLIALTALAVWRFGADSRDGRDWASRSEPARNTPYAPCC